MPPLSVPLLLQVDPFDPNSPIKQGGITSFPGDLFFILRVVQLLRGMGSGEERRGGGGGGGQDGRGRGKEGSVTSSFRVVQLLRGMGSGEEGRGVWGAGARGQRYVL